MQAEAEKDLDLFKAMLPEIRQLRQAFQLQAAVFSVHATASFGVKILYV